MKIEEIVKDNEESTNLIPKLEEEIHKLEQLLLDEEKILEDIKEQSKGWFCLFYHKYKIGKSYVMYSDEKLV